MSLLHKVKTVHGTAEDNTGFGAKSEFSGSRLFNRKTGTANVIKRGMGFFERNSWYHTMLAMQRVKFILLLFSIYILINLVFAGVYYLIGIDHLAGIHKGSALKNFTEVFFFSTQTFTTVGYGRISPVGFLASTVATFEAFLGLLSFAIATGLFYGRFSRPQAFLKYSDNAIMAPYKDGIALMFRVCPFKNNTLSEAEVKLTLAMQVEENEKPVNKFYPLELEITKINSLPLSWTLVHYVSENSPLFNFSEKDMIAARCEILVFIKAFDEVFSNTVISRNSYIASEVVWGAKFRMMYHASEDKRSTVLELDRLNDFEKVTIPVPAGVS